VLIAYPFDRSADNNSVSLLPTAVFFAGLILLYSVYIIRGFMGTHHNRKFRDQQLTDEEPPSAPKRVAVVGAGMAGLVAAKELKEEGHEVVVFEKTNSWGGVWASSKKCGGRSWNSTITSTGALNSTLSDSPVPVYNAENGDTPLHFTRQQFHAMLAQYESQHDVFSGDTRYNTEVVSMERIEEKRWRVTSKDDSKQSFVDEFDAVSICTGLNAEPWTPEIEGQGSFRGQEIHVNDYDPKFPTSYKGKNVLIVGVGETAADLARELSANGVNHIYASSRNPTLTLARNFNSQPPDYPESRLVYSGPMFNRWALLILGAITQMYTTAALPARTKPLKAKNWFGLLRPQDTIQGFPSVLASVNTTKSDHLWQELDKGIASLVRGVSKIIPEGVILSDGERINLDTIIYCTGYRTKNSFLPPVKGNEVDSITTASDLYKLTIHPEYNNVALIGFARGLIGAITLSSEMQARWWALLVSEKRSLPGRKQMQKDIDYLRRKGKKFAKPTRTTLTFANSLARNEIGCEPDMFALFKTDKKLWWRLLHGVICNSHYRLFGVHAKPDLARRQLLMPYSLHDPDYRDSIDLFYYLIPVSLALIPIWAFAGKLLPGFVTRSSLETYI